MADGRLVADAHITRAGIFSYADSTKPSGVRLELRPESEVFDSESLASFANLPITDGHPPKLITADTAKKVMVGMTGDHVTRDDEFVKAKVSIADAGTIKKMDAGDVEVSCGYACVVEDKAGVDPKYGRYDAIQRKIRGNHLAVAVGSARAGRTARVRMDSELTDQERSDAREVVPSATSHGGGAMDPEKLQETVRALEAGLKTAETALVTQTARADSAETARDVERGKVVTLESQIGTLRATIAANATAVETAAIGEQRERADKAEQLVARFDAEVESRVKERCALMIKATSVLGTDFRMDDLSKRDIESAVVKRLDSTADVSKAVADGVITGQFETLVKGNLRQARSLANAAEVLGTPSENVRNDSAEKRRQELRNLGKVPLPNDIRARAARKEV